MNNVAKPFLRYQRMIHKNEKLKIDCHFDTSKCNNALICSDRLFGIGFVIRRRRAALEFSARYKHIF